MQTKMFCFVSNIQDSGWYRVISWLTNIPLDENKLNTYAFIMSAVWRPMSMFICKAVCSISFGYAAGSHRVKLVYQVHRLWNSTKNDVGRTECCFSSHCSRLSHITVKFSHSQSESPWNRPGPFLHQANSARPGSHTQDICCHLEGQYS